MGSQEQDYIVYLSSLGCVDVYPNNAPGSFQNNIIPIILSPNREYEVALHGIFIPRQVYTLHRDDKECVVEVYVEKNPRGGNETITKELLTTLSPRGAVEVYAEKNPRGANESITKELLTTLSPKRNILTTNTKALVQELNQDWADNFRELLGGKYISPRGIISYVGNHVYYIKRSMAPDPTLRYHRVSLLFKSRVAAVLGFIPNHYYDIFVTDEAKHYPRRDILADSAPHPLGDVDYLHMYCDIIQPYRFAGQMVNILATLPYGGSENYYSVQSPLYKKLSKRTIDSVAVLVTDQYGRKIYFEEHRSVAIVLHIRPIPHIF